MTVTCRQCGKSYDDTRHWTLCPHNEFITVEDAKQKDLAFKLLGKRVRFLGAAPDAPLAEGLVTSINGVGMVTLDVLPGEFAPHLFEVVEKPLP